METYKSKKGGEFYMPCLNFGCGCYKSYRHNLKVEELEERIAPKFPNFSNPIKL